MPERWGFGNSNMIVNMILHWEYTPHDTQEVLVVKHRSADRSYISPTFDHETEDFGKYVLLLGTSRTIMLHPALRRFTFRSN